MKLLLSLLLLLLLSCDESNNKDTTSVKDELVEIKINTLIQDFFKNTKFKIESSFFIEGNVFNLKLFENGKGTFNKGAIQAYILFLLFEFHDELSLDNYERVIIYMSNRVSGKDDLVFLYSKSQLKNNLEKLRANPMYINNLIYCLNNFNDSIYYEFDILLKNNLPKLFVGFNPNELAFMDVLPLYSYECEKDSLGEGVLLMRGLAFYIYMTAQENKNVYKSNEVDNRVAFLNHFLSNCNLSLIDLSKKVTYEDKILVDGKPW